MISHRVHRRDYLYGLGASLGSVAFSSLLADEVTGMEKLRARGPLQPNPGHLAPHAKRCIFLMMEGGPSHVDTFDPKPKLRDLHLSEFVRRGEDKSAMESGTRYFVESPFRFQKAGQCGADMSMDWRYLAGVADDLCFYRGCQVDSVNHPTALYQMNTGNRLGGDPAIGAWVTYGLGTDNQDLPGFIVLPEVAYPQGGAANWSNGFLPSVYQGTALRAEGSPILNLRPPYGYTLEHQRTNIDLLQRLNADHLQRLGERDELAARMESYELAFRMQTQVPGILNIGRESGATRRMYGVDEEPTAPFARKCLLARRLVERGVRFVQLYAGTWDAHDYIGRNHAAMVRAVDQPIAALITDLKQRGLVEDTLVIWCGEFGRSPDNGIRGGVAYGRDHNNRAMTIWLAGGGVRAGHTIGATDETGAEAVECVHPIQDLHVTLLRLLGLDDARLTYFHGGRFKQLSQFGGNVIEELIA
jgi:hypothetical protein